MESEMEEKGNQTRALVCCCIPSRPCCPYCVVADSLCRHVLPFVNSSGLSDVTLQEGEIESLVRHFGSTWKSGIAHMAKSINTYFQNLKNGMSILKLCLTQLLLYNTRFQDIIKKLYANKSIPFSKELVPIQTVLYEIKKYSQ